MIILPAIDIIEQKPVRLYQGDYGKQEQVGNDILELAQMFEKEGAQYLHMVDLDGAKKGEKCNQQAICEVAASLHIPIEVGGGIRNMKDIAYYLEHGVERVILGTAAIENRTFLKQAVQRYQAHIAVGIDCRDGYVCGRGWLSESKLHYLTFAKEMQELGIKTIIVTDIAKDGTMMGPNVDMLKKLKESVDINIIASGGIRDLSHIQALKDLGIYGAITGKAMYAKTLSLPAALALCKEE